MERVNEQTIYIVTGELYKECVAIFRTLGTLRKTKGCVILCVKLCILYMRVCVSIYCAGVAFKIHCIQVNYCC